jgi:hypothetical protein
MRQKKILLSMLFPLCFLNAAQPAWDEQILSVPGIQQVYPVDMDCDQLLDLIVVHAQPENPSFITQRIVSVFLNRNGYHVSQADYLAADEVVMDWADIDLDGLLELAFIRPDSICFWNPVRDDRYSASLGSSLLLGADPVYLPHWSFLFDVDSETGPEILLPTRHGIQIYKPDSLGLERSFLCLQSRTDVSTDLEGTLNLKIRLPNIKQEDMNNDSFPDILLLSGDKMTLFLNIWAGRNAPELITAENQMRFAVDDRNHSMLESLAPADNRLEVTDLNHDGYADALLSYASKAGFTKSTSQLQIYFSREGRFNALPDQVLMADNFFGDHIVADLNQDGLEDLALLQFPFGLIRAARFLLTRRMKYGFDIYYQQRGSGYAGLPDQKLRFTRHSKLRNVLRPEVATFLDWNGDGLKDLLVNVNRGKLVVFFQQNGRFPGKPSVHIDIPVSTHYWTGDLNKDRYEDLIFWYPADGSIRILENRIQPE